VDQGGGAQSSPSVEGSQKIELQEIVVTAQKRIERLQDVPVPVTALDAETLAQRNQNRLQDYFAAVPGLSLNAGSFGGGGQQNLSIRGLATGSFSNPTVGIAIDDVPFGASNQVAWGAALIPDLDPGDLDRIEVLRGPQGTLYGASSIGGLIKFVTRDPSVDGPSGRAQVLVNGVQHGELGYSARGSANVPISDVLAVRASGFTRRDPGYIANVSTGQHDVNRADVYGGRLSVLWKPSAAVSLKVAALLQNTEGDGNPAVDADVDSEGFCIPPWVT